MLDVQFGGPAVSVQSSAGAPALLKCRFRLVDQRLEGLRLVDGEVCQNFPVNLDASAPETVDKSAIGEPMLAARGVDPLDPERAEVPLLGLAVAVSVLTGFFDSLVGNAEGIFAAAVIPLCLLDHLTVTGMGGDASFYT
eukprot:s1_g1020.t1